MGPGQQVVCLRGIRTVFENPNQVGRRLICTAGRHIQFYSVKPRVRIVRFFLEIAIQLLFGSIELTVSHQRTHVSVSQAAVIRIFLHLGAILGNCFG